MFFSTAGEAQEKCVLRTLLLSKSPFLGMNCVEFPLLSTKVVGNLGKWTKYRQHFAAIHVCAYLEVKRRHVEGSIRRWRGDIYLGGFDHRLPFPERY